MRYKKTDFDRYKEQAEKLDTQFGAIVEAVNEMHNGGIYSDRFGRRVGRVKKLLLSYDRYRDEQDKLIKRINKGLT